MIDNPICNPHIEGDPFYWDNGPTGVLLIHGFTATTAEVRLLAKSLHQSGYTVAGPLLPGHGSLPEDLNRVSWQDWVDAAEEMYQRITGRCERVFVGGESTGAVLSLYLASKHPEIAGILAYAPALRLNLHPLDIFRLYLLAPFISCIPKPNMRDNTQWQGYFVNPLKGIIQLIRLQKQVRSLLSNIHQPVLIVQGRLDPTVHSQVPEIISSGVKSNYKETHWMEKSGHVVLLDREFESVSRITLEFLNRVLNSGS